MRAEVDQRLSQALPRPSGQAPVALVVDDDPAVRTLCAAALGQDYHVVLAENGQQAIRQVFQCRPDVVLLDVNMPVMNGWETCRRIRELADLPIIMLTAHGADEDVARGLDGGADDYVTKPFRPTQLLARLRAVRRRHAAARPEEAPPVYAFDEGRFALDTARRAAVVDGREVPLTAIEYKLLETLARHAGRVLTHDQILEHVWGPEYVGETGYVKTYVGLLRNKVEPDPHRPRYIVSRRGLGYYLDNRPVASAAA